MRFRTHLLVSERFDTSASRLTCVVAKQPRIGCGWMPVIGDSIIPIETAKALAIWYNSTLGRLFLRKVCGRKLSYPQYRPDNWHNIPTPQLQDNNTVEILERCFNDTCSMEIPSFREGRDEVRELWDDAISSALQIDRRIIEEVADKLASEPTVSKSVFYETL